MENLIEEENQRRGKNKTAALRAYTSREEFIKFHQLPTEHSEILNAATNLIQSRSARREGGSVVPCQDFCGKSTNYQTFLPLGLSDDRTADTKKSREKLDKFAPSRTRIYA